MALVVLSYREVVAVYTRCRHGSYVGGQGELPGPRGGPGRRRGPLLIDYVVTVAVQVAAGTAAVASAIPALNKPTIITLISIAIVILMCYGNLRGIREAGRAFAVPTYLFSGRGHPHDRRGPGPGRPWATCSGDTPYPQNRASTVAQHGHNTSSLIQHFGMVFACCCARSPTAAPH